MADDIRDPAEVSEDVRAAETPGEPTPATVAADPAQTQHGFFTRLYTGTGAFEVVGRRKQWFAVSGVVVALAILAIAVRGFTLGIDFEGGTQVAFPRGDATVSEVQSVFREALGTDPSSVVVVGAGDSETVQIRAETLDNDQTARLRDALFRAFSPLGTDGAPSPAAISDSGVSSTWGDQITEKALLALAVFLLLVAVYIAVRYERYMAVAALAALVFDLLVTAGVYALVGFEVTPATVIGLLTILGFSLYDTVIVFDKVEENTLGFQHTTRRTFAEQANLAINQTFMRSINTSLISVIPVLSLIGVAVVLLGVGTLQDLALVQLVGILVGTYSSIYFATPLLVALRERTDLVSRHTRKVLARRASSGAGASASDAGAEADADGSATEGSGTDGTGTARPTVAAGTAARPSRPSRPGGTGRPAGGRPARKR